MTLGGREELSGPLELLDPEIKYVNPAGAIEPGTRSGIEAFTAAVDKVFDAWESWRIELEDLTAKGGRVVLVVRYRARGRASGVEVDGRESALSSLFATEGRAL
jgi:hypothetical protein